MRFQSHGKCITQHLLVVEVMLHPLYVLIVLVALAGNEDDIALLGKHAGRADGLTTVNDGDNAGLLCRGEPRKHVIDDVLRLLEAGVVAGDDDLSYAFIRLHERLLRE